MKKVWVQLKNWNKDIVTTALENGADALVFSKEGLADKARELGRIAIVAPDGDLKPDKDVVHIAVNNKKDEERAATTPHEKTVILAMSDWKIIPLENLIARRSNLMVEVASVDEARAAIQTLEKGADGVVIVSDDPAQVKKIIEATKEVGESVELVEAEVTDISQLGLGDRVCVDTCNNMALGEGMLVGNASNGFLLVHSESMENPYVEPRPFRVNAGAVHAYTLSPGGKTRYLSELKSGDEVLIVNNEGRTRLGYIGRCKVERRPLLLIKAKAGDREVALVLQNAETIRLTSPDGSAVSVAKIKPGDRILAHVSKGGRHFGMKVEETIDER